MVTIGIDFGATYTRFGVVSKSGKITKKVVFATPKSAAEIKKSFELAFKYIHGSGISKKAPVGVASIGPLSIRRGMVVRTPNLGGIDIKLRDIVEEFHHGPFVMMNDCTAAALGEKFFGAARRTSNLVYVTLSTGIGGGAIVDDHLLMGKDGNAVEVGHIVVDACSRVRCGCGGHGHWEALCSGTGLPKLAADTLGKTVWRSSYEIFEAASRGSSAAISVLEKMAAYNAAGFASVINCFDPEVLVVGGGMALSHPVETVAKAVKILKKFALLKAKIKLTSLGPDASLLGAAASTMLGHES